MIFLSLIVVLLLVQWWGSGAPLQYDAWFIRWSDTLKSVRFIGGSPVVHFTLTLLIPAVILALLVYGITTLLSANWLFFIYVPALLYSLGRGNFSAEVKAYIAASERGDNVVASKLSDELRGGAMADEISAEVADWSALHRETLRVISYRGFERMFAVLFWFFIFGAVGALVYRLSVIYRERETVATARGRLAARWLWLVEWPAVRVMGLTWALVGNFETCYRCWQARLLDVKHSSTILLNHNLRGALGVGDPDMGGCDTADNEPVIRPDEPVYSLSLIKSSLPLFSRSLLLWVCVIALITLML